MPMAATLTPSVCAEKHTNGLTTEFSAKFPRKQGYTRDNAPRFLVPCQGLAPEPQGQFLPLLPMATTAKNAHENGHILFRFFGVFLPLRTTFAQKRCSEYPLESFMTVLEACSRPN